MTQTYSLSLLCLEILGETTSTSFFKTNRVNISVLSCIETATVIYGQSKQAMASSYLHHTLSTRYPLDRPLSSSTFKIYLMAHQKSPLTTPTTLHLKPLLSRDCMLSLPSSPPVFSTSTRTTSYSQQTSPSTPEKAHSTTSRTSTRALTLSSLTLWICTTRSKAGVRSSKYTPNPWESSPPQQK